MNNAYKVFAITNGIKDKSYCYSKAEALTERGYWQSLGIKKVMIKRCKI